MPGDIMNQWDHFLIDTRGIRESTTHLTDAEFGNFIRFVSRSIRYRCTGPGTSWPIDEAMREWNEKRANPDAT